MRGKVIAFHSFKGGTGKTIIVTNLAAIYASKGKNVCLLDMDLRAPSLGITFKGDTDKNTINDLLNGHCKIKDVIIDVQQKYATKGRFLVGLADHSPKAIQEIITKDRKWEMKALQRIITLKNTLINEMEMDYVLLDTSPGVQYSSINAISNADIVFTISIFDESDIDGTGGIIQNIYESLEKKVYIIMNKVPLDFIISEDERRGLLKTVKATLNKPILTLIHCYCEVQQSKRRSIFAYTNPQHHFTKSLYELSERITEIN